MMRSMTAAELAERVGGVLEGDGSTRVTGLAGLKEAEEGDLSFLANAKYAGALAVTKASVVIVGREGAREGHCAKIRVDHPDRAFAAAVAWMTPPAVVPAEGLHATAVIAADATLGRDVSVGPFCVIEPGASIGAGTRIGAGCYVGHETAIGAGCLLHPHVMVRERCRVGDRVILHSGAVIGSDGFGYSRVGERWEKIPQVGIVEIGDDVELGANVTVDRARFGKTVIGAGAKIDNLVQIAHNVRVGEHSAMAAQVGISGSSRIGRGVQLGGQVGMAGHLEVGDGAVILAQSGLSKDVPPGEQWFGTPAMPVRQAFETHAHVQRLGALKQKLRELETRLVSLEKRSAAAGPDAMAR